MSKSIFQIDELKITRRVQFSPDVADVFEGYLSAAVAGFDNSRSIICRSPGAAMRKVVNAWVSDLKVYCRESSRINAYLKREGVCNG